jgi:hypothetical protein
MLLGCGKKTVPQKNHDPMARPVTALADAARSAKQFPLLFAAGAVPSDKERRRYAEYMYIVKDVRPLSDAAGELRVVVIDSTKDEEREMAWTVINDEGRWKLKSAPLP